MSKANWTPLLMRVGAPSTICRQHYKLQRTPVQSVLSLLWQLNMLTLDDDASGVGRGARGPRLPNRPCTEFFWLEIWSFQVTNWLCCVRLFVYVLFYQCEWFSIRSRLNNAYNAQKNRLAAGPGPAGKLKRFPRPLSRSILPTSKERGRRRRERPQPDYATGHWMMTLTP